MSNRPKISDLLIDQRLRNRIMEELYGLAEWQESLKDAGFVEYFETFFDVFPYQGEAYANEAMTEEERVALREVHALMVDALSDTPEMMTDEAFIATGWPHRIEPVAEKALKLMLSRGRFSEDQEEAGPSSDDGWPWRDRFRRHPH